MNARHGILLFGALVWFGAMYWLAARGTFVSGQDEPPLALAIAFLTPILLFLSYAIAPMPMNLLFSTFEVVALGLAVLTIAFVAHDGETHWMEGVQMLAVYAILCLGFYFLPARA